MITFSIEDNQLNLTEIDKNFQAVLTLDSILPYITVSQGKHYTSAYASV